MLCVQLESKLSNIMGINLYRVPTRDFGLFVNELENNHYKPKTLFVIYGNINIDYRTESNRKQCLNSLLTSHNLMSRVSFLTEIKNYSGTAIDSMFI